MNTTINIFNLHAGARPKWWFLELRFGRKLTEREVRVLQDSRLVGMPVGVDGVSADAYPVKYPDTSDSDEVVRVVRKIGAPARVRVAPQGRDCSAGCENRADVDRPCRLGNAGACWPIFRDTDWIEIDPMATGRAG